jgi:hypothetical protein
MEIIPTILCTCVSRGEEEVDAENEEVEAALYEGKKGLTEESGGGCREVYGQG